MNSLEFTRLVITYGADLSRWPPTLQAAAKSLLDAQPELRPIVKEAAGFDAALQANSTDIADERIARLKTQVLARARLQRPAHREQARSTPGQRFLELRWSWMAAGFAAATCLLVLLQTARPAVDAQVSSSAIVALLEYDSVGVLEEIR